MGVNIEFAKHLTCLLDELKSSYGYGAVIQNSGVNQLLKVGGYYGWI